jgi:hypothetical protein
MGAIPKRIANKMARIVLSFAKLTVEDCLKQPMRYSEKERPKAKHASNHGKGAQDSKKEHPEATQLDCHPHPIGPA